MTITTEQHEKGLALTRSVTTPTLVASFLHSDTLLECDLTEEQRAITTTARGWIITVLDERGQLELVGFDEGQS